MQWFGGLIVNLETGTPSDNTGDGLLMIDTEKEEFFLVGES